MKRLSCLVLGAFVASFLVACGGGSVGGSSGSPNPQPQDVPVLTSIAPATAPAGFPDLNLVVNGSNFKNGATVNWNGAALASSFVSDGELMATIPGTDLASTGSAQVTVTNPSPGGSSHAKTFTVTAASAATTFVREVPGIAAAQDIAWDAQRQKLYVSMSSGDALSPNTIIVVDPKTATSAKPVAVGNNPRLLSLSSDASYLWVGLDGDNAVDRFVLPALTKDVSIPLPTYFSGDTEQATSLEAAPVNPHTVGFVAGPFGTGAGLYVYDDGVQRPAHVAGRVPHGGPWIDWLQWGADDSTIYANQYSTIDLGGVATVLVNASGATFQSYNGGIIGPVYSRYDRKNGRLYSTNGVFNPTDGSQIGSFAFAIGERVCTQDSALGRYYCIFTNQDGGTDVSLFELWVYDLNSYALIDRVYFGASAGIPASSVTGSLVRVVRWGNSGLALITNSQSNYGNGGLFLIDGTAVNPNASPDVSSGERTWVYPWLSSLQPQQVSTGSTDVQIKIKGRSFSQYSSACWNCNYLQFQFLPTTFINAQELDVTIPAAMLATPGQLPISVFDTGSNLFSSDSLTLVVSAPQTAADTTQVHAMGLMGLSMDWDPKSSLLYIGTPEYEAAYPNSIVAVDPSTYSIVKTQTVGSNPDLMNISAGGQYVYVGYAGATSLTQLPLPGLESQLTWTLRNSVDSSVYWAGDMRAAPENPHTTAVDLFDFRSDPYQTGGVVIYDDNIERSKFVPGWSQSTNLFDNVAWGPSDEVLTAAAANLFSGGSNLATFQVTPMGATLLATGTQTFSDATIHSDFATGLIYSDDGSVLDPTTRAVVGNFDSSGLVIPDSALNRVFILGQTQAQGGTNDYTIVSYKQKTYAFLSAISVKNIVGVPVAFSPCGNSCLAILTFNGGYGATGMLHLVTDTSFISQSQNQSVSPSVARLLVAPHDVKRRWRHFSTRDIAKMLQDRREKTPLGAASNP